MCGLSLDGKRHVRELLMLVGALARCYKAKRYNLKKGEPENIVYFSKILVLQSGRNPGNGQVFLFGLGYDNQVYYTKPMEPPDPAGWICIGGSVFELQGSLNGSGDLELFGRDMVSDQQVWHSWQDASSPTGWHDWVALGHPDH